ncbi:metal-dependent transcriptional regulator [soil metagenome]
MWLGMVVRTDEEGQMTPLIDATEMYLRTVWELQEEGIPPLRARLVERLHLSAPAVSETVGRLQEEGLVRLDENREVQLTDEGAHLAASVMRKHRLAERLLTDVIGLDWEQAHNEACRWEHVISDMVEARLVEVLGDPATSPFGNPIPAGDAAQVWSDLVTTREAAQQNTSGRIARISERLQVDVDMMRQLREQGVTPGALAACRIADGSVTLEIEGVAVRFDDATADMVWIEAA